MKPWLCTIVQLEGIIKFSGRIISIVLERADNLWVGSNYTDISFKESTKSIEPLTATFPITPIVAV